MDKYYDSEFTRFMETFLKQHPEVVEEQMHRWHLEWDPKQVSMEEQDVEAAQASCMHLE